MEDNPFTLVFDALWTLAERHPRIRSLVRERNRIKFNDPSDRNPLKKTVAVADTPELMLTSDGLSGNLLNTSSTCMVTRDYTWWVTTGDYRINSFLHQVEWPLFVAMCDYKHTLNALEWRGLRFVKRANLTGVTEAQIDQLRDFSLAGWGASWRVEVEMHFKTSDLIDELSESSSSG
jgi:hypothetical protein